MLTPSGTWMRITWRNARSSASMSIKRLWIRISQWSIVLVPPPSGPLRTGTRSFFVGSGIGPAIATPVFAEISRICLQIESTLWESVPLREIRAFCIDSPSPRSDQSYAALLLALLDVDDDARRDGLSHVPDGEPTELGELFVLLDHQRPLRSDHDDRGVPGLQRRGVLLGGLARLRVEPLQDLRELAGDLGRVGVKDRRVADRQYARVVEDLDVGREALHDRGGVRDRARDVAAPDIVLVDAPHVEPDVV